MLTNVAPVKKRGIYALPYALNLEVKATPHTVDDNIPTYDADELEESGNEEAEDPNDSEDDDPEETEEAEDDLTSTEEYMQFLQDMDNMLHKPYMIENDMNYNLTYDEVMMYLTGWFSSSLHWITLVNTNCLYVLVSFLFTFCFFFHQDRGGEGGDVILW